MFSPSHVTFLTFIMFSILLVSSSTSWLVSWVGIELNTLCFIPLMLSFKSGREGESAIKYFLTQTLASVILLISILFIKSFSFTISSIFLSFALFIKMGVAPFHSWMVAVGETLHWLGLYLLLTIQKINPLIMIISSSWSWGLLLIAIIFSSVMGAILGLSHTNLRKLLIFSSINHLGWLLMAMTGGLALLSIYFLIYCLLLTPIVFLSKKSNLNYLNQISSLPHQSHILLIVLISMLSLGGLPPFLGFFPKWLVINQLVWSENFILCMILILSSLFTLYYYLRISYSSLILSKLLIEPRWQVYSYYFIFSVTLTSSLMGFILIFLC
uniref:NADH-ubiquinone oxidoreductase chain 2 n=1 Tax=Diaphanosoma excisum TaxID=2094052 RepID=A0A8A1RXD4_9CRUS|nr:NADH dehydrogenase subunit 2 [Diaphanosoma excisum]QST19920.1 NADH dehydrogenase subunit 2 [Diaphanosoma excisum]